ncbi:hypothetical protein HELRODRAFT_66850 [Helobdella robusta]|uniref:Protein-serine/threonine kinase n=1 Tax=Helobdella robusta TaxID=6412 RepID=T1FYR9_HELRO|nr:hypothetical protein HELRODRAFT_66850 [Helobdella robusta]ESN99119.1 hypothetical protein HELRODRAFT_66850 [Helobdella robusta]
MLSSFNKFYSKISQKFVGALWSKVHVSQNHISPQAERIKYVTSFYYQNAIDLATTKSPVRLMPLTMLYSGKSPDNSHLVKSAQYLQRELPIRFAHQVSRFRKLPFIAGVHPLILEVHDLYIRSFHNLNNFPPVDSDFKDELAYCGVLKTFLEEHKNDVSLLTKGLKDVRNFVKEKNVLEDFLEKVLNSRIATELLCKHHIILQKEIHGNIGIITLGFSPKAVIENKIRTVKKLCEEKFGVSTEFEISGHTDAKFAFITQPFGNIMQEILFNAAKATIEANPLQPPFKMPKVEIIIANNELDFIIKVSDRGVGIDHNKLEFVCDFDLSKHENNFSDEHDGYLADEVEFGLPVCRTYARCLGGNIEVDSMVGYGTDVYLRLGHIDGKGESFRI